MIIFELVLVKYSYIIGFLLYFDGLKTFIALIFRIYSYLYIIFKREALTMNPTHENMFYYPSDIFLQALPYEASKLTIT